MNYIIANSVCCCLQCCCKQMFETMYKLIGKSSFIKIMYFIIYSTFIGGVLLLFTFLRDWPFFMQYIARGVECESTDDFDCITASLLYRSISAVIVFIVLIMVLIGVSSNRVGHILNQGLFFSKFVIILGLFLVMLQLGNSVFEYISVGFEFLSYIFLLCQAIIIIDIGYLWGIRWADGYSRDDGNKYAILLIIFTLLNFAWAFGLNIYGYILVSDEQSYMHSIGLISQCPNYPNVIGSLLILLCISIQLLNFNKQNSLLTTSFLSMYVSFWCFSAIYSSNQCNLNHEEGQHYSKSDLYYFGTVTQLVILVISTFGSIFGSTNKITDDENAQGRLMEMQQNHKQYTRNVLEGGEVGIYKKIASEHESENKFSWIIWHFFMLTMVIYLSMVLTDWGSGNLITGKYSLNQNAFNSKLFMGMFSFSAYAWTLLAPRICPNRNFYFE